MTALAKPSALLFDLDGTLVDSKRDIQVALNSALAAVHREPLSLEVVTGMIGDGARVLVTRALGADISPLEPALAHFHAVYAEQPCAHTTLLPGAREALAIDLPHAVVTNKPRAITLLVLAKLGVDVPVVYAGGDGPLKPAPDGVESAARQLGVDVKAAWLVGDGPQDVRAGKAAGCVTIAVPGIAERAHVLAAGPDHVVTSLLDIAPLVAAAQRR